MQGLQVTLAQSNKSLQITLAQADKKRLRITLAPPRRGNSDLKSCSDRFSSKAFSLFSTGVPDKATFVWPTALPTAFTAFVTRVHTLQLHQPASQTCQTPAGRQAPDQPATSQPTSQPGNASTTVGIENRKCITFTMD